MIAQTAFQLTFSLRLLISPPRIHRQHCLISVMQMTSVLVLFHQVTPEYQLKIQWTNHDYIIHRSFVINPPFPSGHTGGILCVKFNRLPHYTKSPSETISGTKGQIISFCGEKFSVVANSLKVHASTKWMPPPVYPGVKDRGFKWLVNYEWLEMI